MTSPCLDGENFGSKANCEVSAETCVDLWNGVNRATPNLAILEFKRRIGSWDDLGDATLTGFPDLSALKSFATNENISFGRISIPAPHLEQLSLGTVLL